MVLVAKYQTPVKEFATLDASIGFCFKLMIEGEYSWLALRKDRSLCCNPISCWRKTAK